MQFRKKINISYTLTIIIKSNQITNSSYILIIIKSETFLIYLLKNHFRSHELGNVVFALLRGGTPSRTILINQYNIPRFDLFCDFFLDIELGVWPGIRLNSTLKAGDCTTFMDVFNNKIDKIF